MLNDKSGEKLDGMLFRRLFNQGATLLFYFKFVIVIIESVCIVEISFNFSLGEKNCKSGF